VLNYTALQYNEIILCLFTAESMLLKKRKCVLLIISIQCGLTSCCVHSGYGHALAAGNITHSSLVDTLLPVTIFYGIYSTILTYIWSRLC